MKSRWGGAYLLCTDLKCFALSVIVMTNGATLAEVDTENIAVLLEHGFKFCIAFIEDLISSNALSIDSLDSWPISA